MRPKASYRKFFGSWLRVQNSGRTLRTMEPIKRKLISHVNNVTAQEVVLLVAELEWSPTNPLDVKVSFVSTHPAEVPNVEWVVGVDFLAEAVEKGSAGHPNVSPCLAEIAGEDFVLTLRGIDGRNGQVTVSHITWDLEQVQLLVRQIQLSAGELDYSPEVDRLIASLEAN